MIRPERVVRITLAIVIVAALAAVTWQLTARSSPGSGDAASDQGTAATSPTLAAPAFHGTSRPLTAKERRWMSGLTWHKGCPVPMRSLRLLTMDYHDFTGTVAQGRMVVNKRVSDDMLTVFEMIFNRDFQIEHLDTTDLYPPALRPDKLQNVSAAFNCRNIAGTSTWSQHAFGLAVDLNPVQNPWVDGNKVIPKAGRPYRDRHQHLPGMVHAGDGVVHAFSHVGWGWGGTWHSFKDYMHFSMTGG